VRRGWVLLTARLLGRPLLPQEVAASRLVYEANREAGARAWRDIMATVNGVVVATPALADVVRPHNPRVHMIPNGIDPDELAHTPFRPAAYRHRPFASGDEPLRIGISGSGDKFHHNDVGIALPALVAAARTAGVQVHVFGWTPENQATARLEGVPCRWHALTDTLTYQRALGILDVSVHPLRPDIPHNRYRSGQNWMERALHSTACVLQRMEPYWQAVEDETALKASEPEEWTEQVMRLVTNAPLRRRIGEAARAEILANHSTTARQPLWEALLADVPRARLMPAAHLSQLWRDVLSPEAMARTSGRPHPAA
jgi:glycosyltransferase involved in cell wall biosynthesis